MLTARVLGPPLPLGPSRTAACRCLQATLASKDKLAATQQQTIARLEATIQEQQADIRSALDLVSSRPSMHSAAAAPEGGMHVFDVGGTQSQAEGSGGVLGSGDAAAAGTIGWGGVLSAGWASLSGNGVDHGGLDAWAGDVSDGEVEAEEDWSIPAACGVGGSLGSSPASPAKPAAPKQQDHSGGGGTQKLSCGAGACPGLASLESDISGLEAALRTALGDLSF